jgi:hypothetical protein
MYATRAFRVAVTTLFLLIAAFAVPMRAQNFYGSITGTVTDSTGAQMEGANVTVINTATGTRQSVQTSTAGEYRLVNLIPGTYRLEIEKTGFKRLTRDNVEVQVESVVRLDSSMEIGDVNQSIEVEAAAPLLQTENASLSQVVSNRSVEQLPLNGRNVLNLVNLVPGVVPQGSSDGSLTGKNVFAAGNYQIGGGTANQSATFFDGVPVNITYGNITALTPSPDAVAEFRVQTSNNTAEYGRYTGGVVNIASRGGTNEFHGTAYEYLRNKVLNATDFFANKSGAGKPPFVQNQFGGAVGGPIRKDKTFFFVNYEGFRARQGALFTRTVPLPEQYNGNFSNYLNGSGAQIPIYDPNTQCGAYGNPACSGTTQRTPFAGNIIPPSRINPVAANLLKFPLFAAPTDLGQAFTHNLNFNRNASTGGDNDQINARGDHRLTENQRLLLRFTRWSSTNLPVTPYNNTMRNGDPYSPEHFVTTQGMAADTWVISPTQVLDVRAGVTRWYYTRIPGSLGIDEATLGFPSYFSQIPVLNGLSPSTTIPGIAISSPTLNTIATGLLLGRDMTYALTPTYTWIKGHHTLKFGGEFHRNDLNYFQNNNPGGTFSFDNLFTAAANTGGASGSGMASFLLGLSNNSSLVQTSLFTYAILYYQGYFATDTWQATNKLTVTAGIRWEIPGVYRERYNRQAVFNPNEANPLLNGVTVNGSPVMGAFDLVATSQHPEEGLNPEHYGLVAPRIGLAYRISDKTVIRTGGGVFFIPANVQFSQGPYGNAADYYNNAQNASIDSSVTYATTLSNPFPGGLLAAPGRNPIYQANLLGGSLGGKGQLRFENAGYTEQWNFTVQHQFQHDIALEVGYAGLRGVHLPLGLQLNQLNPSYLSLGSALKSQVANPFYGIVTTGTLSAKTVQAGQLLLPFPEYQTLTDPGNYSGDSTYHALQVKAEKRFSKGGTVLGSYTFSKILANVETLTSWLDSGTGVAGYQNVYNMRAEKALSSFDSRQRLTVSYVYDLPMGKGRGFLGNASGVVDRIVSGWGINGVTTFQRGFPLGITATPNNTGFNTGLRPNVVSGCTKETSGSAQSRLTQWFNTACFTAPAIYTFGNEARTDPEIRGPGIANYDFAIFKNTAITERYHLEFRAEAFNFFNRVQFGTPNLGQTTAANNLFGQITTQQNSPRLMQLALRFRF